jgi:hypothetical protein
MRRVLAAALLACGISSALASEGAVQWGTSGAWTIAVDTSLGNSCFLVTTFVDGTIFRLGFNQQNTSSPMYVGIGNQDWKSLDPGKDYDLQLQLDNLPGWNAAAEATTIGVTPFLLIPTDQVKFVDEFMRRHTLRMYFSGREVVRLNLKGSSQAVNEMLRCQNAVINYTQPPARDPFSGVSSGPKKKDPFSY